MMVEVILKIGMRGERGKAGRDPSKRISTGKQRERYFSSKSLLREAVMG
jgi:hypothetical protein